MSPTNIYWQYFRPIAEGIAQVKTVKLGDGGTVDRMTADSRSEDLYPCVFSLRPKYKLHDNGAHQYLAFFDVVFFVFVPADLDDYASQNAAFNEAEQIALTILQQFKADNNQHCLIDVNTIICDPVSLMTVDAVYAYEVRCKLGLEIAPIFG